MTTTRFTPGLLTFAAAALVARVAGAQSTSATTTTTTTTTTSTTTPAASPAPAVAPFLDVALGAMIMGRHLGYTSDLFGALRSYNLTAAPGIAARAELYPGAMFGHSIPAAVFGLVGGFDYEFPGVSVDMTTGATYPTISYNYLIGLRARAPIPTSELNDIGFELDYAAQRFEVGGGLDGVNGGVPNVGYRYVRAAFSGRIGFGSRVFATWRAGYDFVITPGSVSMSYFPHEQVSGVEFGVGLGVRIAAGFEARAEFGYRHYWYWMNSVPGDNLRGYYVAGGATDDYPSGTLAIAWRP